jgi:hypothetical protein
MPDPEPVDPRPAAEPVEAEPVDAEIVPVDDPAPRVVPPADYDDRGVPSFDYVRDRIEHRAATAAGTEELLPEARDVDEQMAERERKAAEKLAELRRSLGG